MRIGEELLTAKEVAEALRVHEFTVRRWLYKGLLPFVKVGGGTRIRRLDLEKFIRPGKPATGKRKPGRSGGGGRKR